MLFEPPRTVDVLEQSTPANPMPDERTGTFTLYLP